MVHTIFHAISINGFGFSRCSTVNNVLMSHITQEGLNQCKEGKNPEHVPYLS